MKFFQGLSQISILILIFSCAKKHDIPLCDNKYIQDSLVTSVKEKINASFPSKKHTVEILKTDNIGKSKGSYSCKADISLTIKDINYTSGTVAKIQED